MIIDVTVVLLTATATATAVNDISVTVTLNNEVVNPEATFCERVDDCLDIPTANGSYVLKILNGVKSWIAESVSGGVWGSITGTLSDQTDLQNALDAKYDDPTGTTDQYIRGDGSLAVLPKIGGGGGGSVYYFNGNTSQGTISGTTMYQISRAAGTGALATFTRNTVGVLASFITDINDPNRVNIPSGIWIIEAYLSESGGGNNHAQISANLLKWDGATLTTISTGVTEEIVNGSTKDLYRFGITIPSGVTLATTDRIVVQLIVSNPQSKTVTLYTEDSDISCVHTTFANGISTLNGLSEATQIFQTGTSGTDFNISSATASHTFNLPTASATNRGALSSADWSTFNGKIGGSGTTNEIAYFTGASTIGSLTTVAYPSLTELSYVKGVTSDIQTQLNDKKDTDSLLYNNRSNRWEWFIDFEAYPSGNFSSENANFGIAGGAAFGTPTSEANHPGILNMPVAGVGQELVAGTHATFLLLGGGEAYCEFLFRVPTLSTAAQRFVITLGFFDIATAIVDGVYVTLVDNVNSGNFVFRSSAGGVASSFNTGLTITANTWHKVVITVNDAGTEARFYLDGVEPSGIGYPLTTNIPVTAGQLTGVRADIVKTVGATSRNMEIDYMYAYKDFTTAR